MSEIQRGTKNLCFQNQYRYVSTNISPHFVEIFPSFSSWPLIVGSDLLRSRPKQSEKEHR